MVSLVPPGETAELSEQYLKFSRGLEQPASITKMALEVSAGLRKVDFESTFARQLPRNTGHMGNIVRWR